MYRAIPEGNKLLSRRWREKEREIHERKLHSIKHTVDSREPTQFTHILKKSKKTQMLEGKSSGDNNSCIRTLHGDREGESHTLGEDDSHHAVIIESLIGFPRLQDHCRPITWKSATNSAGRNPWACALYDTAFAAGERNREDEEEPVHRADQSSGHNSGDCKDYFNTS